MQRFRGVPSECVIVRGTPNMPVGTDITEPLGIVKYEKPVPIGMAGDPVGSFPSFIPKTDEPNFQAVPHLVEALRGKPCYITVKADGSSGTAYRDGEHFGVCSRNWELKEGENAYWHVANKFDLPSKLPDGFAVQYEVVGPGIQKNPLGFKEVTGLAFNVWSMGRRDYLPYDEAARFCGELGLPMVENVIVGISFDWSEDVMRKRAEGTYGNGKQREGIVIRALDGSRHANERISFKVINLLYKD